jgi:hypothetical protein
LEIENGKSEAETGLTLERDVNKMRVLKLGFEVKMIPEILGLPEIPDGDEDTAMGFEVALDLIENKKLIFLGRQVMENSNTGNIVILG